jgi:hypothetical protein
MSCSAPPEGHARWSLRLLADRLVELEFVDSVSHETISIYTTPAKNFLAVVFKPSSSSAE